MISYFLFPPQELRQKWVAPQEEVIAGLYGFRQIKPSLLQLREPSFCHQRSGLGRSFPVVWSYFSLTLNLTVSGSVV